MEFKKDSDNELQIGKVMLTKIGQELVPICGSSPEPDFFEFICEKWERKGYMIKEKAAQEAFADLCNNKSQESKPNRK